MVLFIVLIIVVAACLAILIVNIEIERAQQALSIVIAAAVAVTIFVLLKSETVDISFPCNFFFDKENSSPLFFNDIFAYRRRNLGATIWSKFTKRKDWREELKKLGEGITQQKAISQNLFEAILLEKLSSLYRSHWNIRASTWRTAMGQSGRIGPEIEKGIKQPVGKLYSKEEIREIFKDNIFIDDIQFYGDNLILPKGTKLTIKRDAKNMTTLIRFKHRIFDASIEFSGSQMWGVGLGSLGELVNISPKEAQEKYAGLEATIILKARFRPGPFGFSRMKQYKRWVETMFAILKNDFGAELLWKEIQDESLFKHIVETDKVE